MEKKDAALVALLAAAGTIYTASPLIGVTIGGILMHGVKTPEAHQTRINLVAPKESGVKIECLSDMGHKVIKLTYARGNFKEIPVDYCEQTDYKP